MSIRNLLKNEKQLYNLIFIVSNAFLILSIIMFSIYLVAPLLGGKLFVSALTNYGGWILLALGLRIMSQRGRRGLRIRIYEYLIACLFFTIYFILCFLYPVNIILSILEIVCMAISYRAQNRRLKEEQ